MQFFCILVLYWSGGHCCSMHCDLFQDLFCTPKFRWICRLILLRGLFFQAWGSLTSMNSQTRTPSLKSLPKDSWFLRPEKSIDFSRVWTREYWIPWRTCYPETTEVNFMCTWLDTNIFISFQIELLILGTYFLELYFYHICIYVSLTAFLFKVLIFPHLFLNLLLFKTSFMKSYDTLKSK